MNWFSVNTTQCNAVQDLEATVDCGSAFHRRRAIYQNLSLLGIFVGVPNRSGQLLLLLMRRLRRDEAQGFRSSGGVLEPAVRLGVTLRVLAGASYIDIMPTFRIAKQTVFDLFWSIVQVINEFLQLPELPLGNENELRRLAIDFTSSRSPSSPLHGCVGALDGVLFKISKPADKYHPAKHYCRKGYYAISLQLLLDSRYKVLYLSAKCAGATHDNLAFSFSTLHYRLMSGELQDGFWIAAGEAYTCTDSIVTPWPALGLMDPAKDALMFFSQAFECM
jgi:hypothetical protein